MNYKKFLESKNFVAHSDGIDINESDINPKLFDFQKAIVKWAVKKGRCAIFADCGLGKTFMQLEWARIIGGKCLILAPLAVSHQTVNEGLKIGIKIKEVKQQDELENGINITNYEKIHKFDLKSIDSIVLDESSILKSFKGKFRNYVIQNTKEVKFKLACTATPSPNDFIELGNHSEFLGIMNRSEMLANFFVHDGGDTAKWRLKGHATDIFWKWVCSWAVYVRNPVEIGYEDHKFELPELKREIIIVKSKTSNPNYLFPMEAQTLEERRIARKSSIDDRVSEAKNNINGSQCLIWCNLNEESEKLKQSIDDSVEISGSDDDDFKKDSMLDFSNGKIKTLITKSKISGFGMNWQNCNQMIFVGLSDSFEQYYQAVRRCWRFGQKKPVTVKIILSEEETSILKNIERKEEEYNIMADEMSKNTKDILNAELHATSRDRDDYVEDKKEGKNWTAYNGDSCELVKNIKDDSVHLSIFSPPFASLYTYSNSIRDMGNSKDNNEFFTHFKFLVNELYRITIPGRMCVFHCMNLPSSKQNDGYIGIKDFRGDLIRLFTESGWIYHSEVVIWKDPVIAMQRTKALGLLHKQIKKDSCMSRMGIPDYVIAMRKPGDNPYRVSHTNDNFPVDLWQKWASPIWDDINPSDTLQKQSARSDEDERHICPLQLEVIRRVLNLWSNKGDTVFSPFMGIGSEGYESIKNERKFIGIELKRSYFEQAYKNLEIAENEKMQSLIL